MEIADVFVINKSDQSGADRIETQLRALLALTHQAGEETPIVRTVATEGEGVADLLAALESRPETPGREMDVWKERLLELLRQRALEHVVDKALPAEETRRSRARSRRWSHQPLRVRRRRHEESRRR